MSLNLIDLAAGGHSLADGEACLMEWEALLDGSDFTDYPPCTNAILARVGQYVNDNLRDRSLARQFLGPLHGTTAAVDHRRLALWSARRVQDLAPQESRDALDVVEAFLDGNATQRQVESAAESAWSAALSAESAESAAWSAESAARSAESAARSARAAARSARAAAESATWDKALVEHLWALIREYDRLARRTEADYKVWSDEEIAAAKARLSDPLPEGLK